MDNRSQFIPIRGLEDTLLNMPFNNGKIYFSTDTGKMYLDCIDNLGNEKNKLSIGGGGVSLIYGNDEAPVPASEEENNTLFSLRLAVLEAKARADDLILNTDGCFYKVLSITDTVANCLRLAVSGSGNGGGSGGVVIQPDVRINFGKKSYDFTSFIYGQKANIEFTPEAENDTHVNLRFQIFDGEETLFEKLEIGQPVGKVFQFDMGKVPVGTNLTMIITLLSPNSNSHPNGITRQISGLNVVELKVRKDPSYVTTQVQTGNVQVNYFIDGGRGFNLKVYPSIDGDPVDSLVADVQVGTTVRNIRIPAQSHGVHTIGIKVGTETISGIVYTDEITYEIAWVQAEDLKPLIWIKDVPEEVVRYENCIISYMVYDPAKALTGSKAEVHLLDSLINEEISTVYPVYSNASTSWLTFDLTEHYHVGENIFVIQCGTSSKEISFFVTEEGSRDLGLVDVGTMRLNLSSTGRSNEESLAKRTTWEYTDVDNHTYTTTFKNFNWYNNGWKDDNDGRGAYLSVANGSSADINFFAIPFNSGNLSYTIELRFRVRNVQEYSTLVKTEPYYFILDNEGNQLPNSVSINTIKEQGLTIAVDKDGNWLMDRIHSIKRSETEKGVCIKFCDPDTNYGLYVGTQEAYFKAPNDTVNVRYKEDDIINLTITAENQKLLSIYLNGILAGAVEIGNVGFTLNTTKFEINSKYCDIDIYKIRVYEANGQALTMPQVIHNFLSDEHNLDLYDQNQLAKDDDPTALSYKKILQYNDTHLTELKEKVLQGQFLDEAAYNILTMPYATIEIIDNSTSMKDPTKTSHQTDDDRLPYFKGGKRYCEINFVNPVADALLEAGKITEDQYYSHAPSYRVVGCEIDVQGTSSQGYPRRNFKTKMKSATGGKDAEKIPHDDWGWFYTKGSKAGKKFKKWNMDNQYYSTNKFTWKIDYMESSGSYNTGFANLMGNMYNYHPLDDYHFDGVSPVGLRTTVYGFPTLVFQKHSKPSDKEKIGKTYEDEIYEYIGRYNINLDKGSNELYGFEIEGEQKYIIDPWDEEVTNEDGSTSIVHHEHPPIADIAECWELTDNQGTWTSFSYPTSAQETHFSTYTTDSYNSEGNLIDNPKLEVIKHFECRYHKDADFIEAIASDENPYNLGGVQDKINDPDTKAAEKAIWSSINTIPKMNRYIIDKWKNLEALMNWLDSTDTRKANANRDITPVTYEISVIPTDMTGATLEVINNINHITFTKDTATYRLEKYRNEFSKHLNLTYCAIYYILTELLLCYDSRGKNMMLASWGPQEIGGDYIWYPIFYDIDTQLGLNNIGATLWDYDTDASAEGVFSTPSSVLWVNFATAFEDIIINTYKTLRNTKLKETNIEGAYLCDPTVFDSYAMRGVRPIIAIGLDEYVKYLKPAINGFYNTQGAISIDSSYGYVYAINGDRKLSRELLIHNRLNYLDSYWRAGIYSNEIVSGLDGCILIRANANAENTSDIYIDTEHHSARFITAPYNQGVTVGIDAIPEYTITPFLSQYVFNYVDGVPTGKPVKFQGTPVQASISDSVLDGYRTTENLTQQITRIPGPEYISSFGDLSVKYVDQFEMPTARRLVELILGSDIEGYYNNRDMSNLTLRDSMYTSTGELNKDRKTLLQKIILTNMGALNTSIDVSGSEKLQEFRALGTQILNAYFADGAPLTTVHLPKTINGLSLVESKNLTHLLTSRPIIRHSIAEGSTFYPHETYEGLYLENITDIDDSQVQLVKQNNGTLVWQNLNTITFATEGEPKLLNLKIKGGNLKYESYKLLFKLIALKEKKAFSGIRLSFDFEDINWCPYTQLSIYDNYNPNNAEHYFQATDHNTFQPYIYNSSTWTQLLKNGKIYYYEESQDENIITSLDLLDFFIQDYNEGLDSVTGRNHYTNLNSTSAHWPKLTGIIYIKNTEMNQIQEDKLTSVYAEKWPDLQIFAKHVKESNLVKYVQTSEDGRENDLEIIRLPDTIDHPALPSITPSKGPHYDFIGWSTDIAGSEMFISYDFETNTYFKNIIDPETGEETQLTATEVLNNYSFREHGTTLILYAQFQVHKHKVDFIISGWNDDGTDVVETYYINYGEKIKILPDKLPYKDDTSNNIVTNQTYKFLGWNYDSTASSVLNFATFKVTRDYSQETNYALYPIWSEDLVSVYDNIHPEWFEITNNNYRVNTGETGYEIKLIKQVKGKLTIPAYIQDTPVVRFCSEHPTTASFQPDQYLAKITHVFVGRKNTNTTEVNLRDIAPYTFNGCYNLEYFEFEANGLLHIFNNAFQNVRNLRKAHQIKGTIVQLGQLAFGEAFVCKTYNDGTPSDEPINLIIGSSISSLGSSALGYQNRIDNEQLTVTFGESNSPSNFIPTYSSGNGVLSGNKNKLKQYPVQDGGPSSIIFYTTHKYESPFDSKETLLRNLFGENVQNNYNIQVYLPHEGE